MKVSPREFLDDFGVTRTNNFIPPFVLFKKAGSEDSRHFVSKAR